MISKFRKTLCVTLLLVLATSASAEQTATLPNGRKVLLKDDGTYKILDEKKEPQSGVATIKMSDLKVDIKELYGKSVRVAGQGHYFSEHLMLGDADLPFDGSPIFVTIDKLPRDMRKWIVSNCSQPCSVTVEGVVKRDIGMFVPGIAATSATPN
jgi:hypothetical protein